MLELEMAGEALLHKIEQRLDRLVVEVLARKRRIVKRRQEVDGDAAFRVREHALHHPLYEAEPLVVAALQSDVEDADQDDPVVVARERLLAGIEGDELAVGKVLAAALEERLAEIATGVPHPVPLLLEPASEVAQAAADLMQVDVAVNAVEETCGGCESQCVRLGVTSAERTRVVAVRLEQLLVKPTLLIRDRQRISLTAHYTAYTLPMRVPFRTAFGGIVVAIAVLWAVYLIAMPHDAPSWLDPQFDARYYLAWSEALVEGTVDDGPFAGAFYRAPLYAYLLALGQSIGLPLATILWLQVLLDLAAVTTLSWTLRRVAGEVASIASLLLFGGYHAAIFFVSRISAESVALPLLILALALRLQQRCWIAVACLGLATLARPNLLLVVLAWAAWDLLQRRWRPAALTLGVLAVALLPAVAWNYVSAAAFVPVSSNGGITLMHGNGPGAVGVFTPIDGMRGDVFLQREEATAVASYQSGTPLNALEADNYWKSIAVRTRLEQPLDSIRLVAARLLLTFDNHEIALDEAPALDPNRVQIVLAVPFIFLSALAAASLAKRGDPALWLAAVALLATPLIFYVSSRYRLPFSVALIPLAAIGVAALWERRRNAWIGFNGMLLLSLLIPAIASAMIPYHDLRARELGSGLAQQIVSLEQQGKVTEAREVVNRALQRSPDSGEVWFALAGLEQRHGAEESAIQAWERAWASKASPGVRSAAAANLGAIWIRRGLYAQAARRMEEAIRLTPLNDACWTNLLVALSAQGRTTEVRSQLARAEQLGVAIDPELRATLIGGG